MPITILTQESLTTSNRAEADGDDLWLPAAELASATGWVAADGAPSLGVCFTAAAAAAIVDLLPLPPDDNVPAAAAAGGVLAAFRMLT